MSGSPGRPIVRREARAEPLPGLEPVLARVYAARGITSADELVLGLDGLLPVGTLAAVGDAARLLAGHRDRRVLVVGDFDADGATASALMVRALRRLGFAAVDFLVPDRFRLGYGLSTGVVELARQRSPSLIVTVDNGVSSVEGVALARALGIDVLITDHHLPGSVLPDATVHVNPNLPGSGFGSRALAGVGVAFYVLVATARELGRSPGELTEYLDLVALGTVADVVPLDRNNRILVEQGLRRVRAGRTLPGIRALCAVARRPLESLVASDFGFFVGPRLNAAGRLTDMSIGIECLLADDEARAQALAGELDQLNVERREIESRMQAEAERILVSLRFDEAGATLPLGLCLYDRSWHSGVVGLVASRVKDRVHRPVIAFAPGEDGTARGSARSIAGVHVRDVLEAISTAHPGLIDRFGGHAMAAGLTIAEDRVREFSAHFAAEVARRAEPSMLSGAIVTDGALEPGQMTLATATSLRGGGPWGSAFPEPSFDGVFTVLDAREVGEGHAKLTVRLARSAPPLDAIAFNWLKRTGRVLPRPGSAVELVYRLDINEYQGIRRLQLLVDELAPRAAADLAGSR